MWVNRMSDFSQAVTELRNAAQSLISVADSLNDLFGGEVAPQPESAPEEKPITLETVRAVLAEKSRSGFTREVKMLIEKHGAARLSEVDPANYKTLLAEAEVLGDG
ncbi:hypothetical protein [Desulfoscipio gibsoniae]|jgi:hypothetical protein|uniref:DNA ligase n=1 Tax=Desulfoscipio gibsoniae DSM 7213 TaxID=767817 RepID=R4KVW1_9FIRM|nr:hypothetical protein Desgi_4533 [Desulfoscipio gibsoniae DSM 7213]